MPRRRIYEYAFTPGTAGLGTVVVQGKVNLDDFLAIYNTTDNICIYNFGDPALGGSIVYNSGTPPGISNMYNGYTTLYLDFDTSLMSSSDKLSIYFEDEAIITKPWSFGLDAIGRERVANPESLIDADFEYGLQNTKWQNVATTNQIPNFYEAIGADTNVFSTGYISLLAGDDVITSNVDTSIRLQNPGTPNWVADDYALVISQTQGNTAAFVTTYLTANIQGSQERTVTVTDTTGFLSGDLVLMIGKPISGGTTLATNITSTGTTSFSVADAAGAGIIDGVYVIVETDTAGVFEVMAVTAVATNILTVRRQVNGTNSGGANLSAGNDIWVVAHLEISHVEQVTDSTTLQLNRGWYNAPAANSLYTGTAIQRLSSNVELVKMTAIDSAVRGLQTITRGQFNTTPLTDANVGSPVIHMVGVFNASGLANVPEVVVNAPDNTITANGYVNMLNCVDSAVEGTSLINVVELNNFSYYPRRNPNRAVGYPENLDDLVVREAFPYTGAELDVQSIVSDELTPSTITVTTTYAHGLNPGTPLLVNLSSAGSNEEYGEGSFVLLSIPSTNTFTFQAKSGAAITNPIVGDIFVRTNAAFIPRPFDGGVILGPGSPTRGASAIRQTKKYFRYQSGKGFLFTSGTMLKPTFDIVDIYADGTAVNSNITVETDIENGLNPGAEITISGITSTGYDGEGYVVTGITSDTAFTVQAQETLETATPTLGQQPRINISAWHGASIRAGMFDDQNGLFWECDGQSVNVVQRSSTFQLAGFVSVGEGQNLVTGEGTRFQDQLNIGDVVNIRGMSHTITSILDNNTMTVVPPYRGQGNQQRVKMTLRNEIRIRQTDFNVDPLDGTGYSGFTLNANKMQMIGVEYSWYGAGYVQYIIRGQDGDFVVAHRRPNNNLNNEAFMRSGNLPARYEAANDSPISSLDGAISNVATQITLRDATDYPDASVTYPVYCRIDSEIIKYSGKTGNTLTGVTRAATLTQWAEGASRSYTGGTASSHDDNTGVILISNTCVPLVNHWGSAIIMDGSFDGDEGYQFTFNRTNYGLPANGGDRQVAFVMRLAPSVSNGIIGYLGERDLINRAQLTLSNMVVNITAGRYLIEGILNPTNIDAANTDWAGLNNLGGGFQPSFTQFAVAPRYSGSAGGGLVGSLFGSTGGFVKSGLKKSNNRNRTYTGITPTNVSSSGSGGNISVRLTRSSNDTPYTDFNTEVTVQVSGTGYAVDDVLSVAGNLLGGSAPTYNLTLRVAAVSVDLNGGERLFAIPISTTNSGVLNLSSVKQIGTSAVPGQGTFPNGPEILAVTITALETVSNPVGEIQLQFQESQA